MSNTEDEIFSILERFQNHLRRDEWEVTDWGTITQRFWAFDKAKGRIAKMLAKDYLVMSNEDYEKMREFERERAHEERSQ